MQQDNIFVCPGCGQIDAVQRVSSIVGAGTATGAYTGNTSGVSYNFGQGGGFGVAQGQVNLSGSSQTLLAQRLTLPAYSKQDEMGTFLAGALIFCGLGGVTLFIQTVTPGLAGLIAAVVFLVLGIGSFGLSFEEHKKTNHFLAAMRPIWSRAAQIWSYLYYCHRCDAIFLPGEAVLYPPEEVRSYLRGVTVIPDYVGLS